MTAIDLRLEHTVPRPLTDVWAFVVDGFFVNHPKWDRAITDMARLTGEGVAVGTRGVEVRRFGGEQRAEFEVVACEPQRRFAFTNTTGPFALDRSYTFAEERGATTMVFTFRMAPKGVMKVLFPLFKKTIERQVRGNIERLTTLLAA